MDSRLIAAHAASLPRQPLRVTALPAGKRYAAGYAHAQYYAYVIYLSSGGRRAVVVAIWFVIVLMTLPASRTCGHMTHENMGRRRTAPFSCHTSIPALPYCAGLLG